MRIFIGLTEIANIGATYAKGFRALGHETCTLVLNRNHFYPDAHYDFVVEDYMRVDSRGSGLVSNIMRQIEPRKFTLRKFWPILKQCDVFIFLFGTSFLPRYWDYPILKWQGKQIVSVFLGSDTRYGYALEQELRLMGLNDEFKPFLDYVKQLPNNSYCDKLKIVQVAERYADLILSQPGYAQLNTKPYMRMNIPLDLTQFRFNVPDREVPLILHAPSNQAIKGTKYILAAIDQLKQEGVSFEFRLIEKMPNPQVRELLAEADIVVDELFADTVGTLSAEAMASGNAVLVRYLPEYTRVPPGCPAVNVTREMLADKLREVILNRDLRRQLAHTGRLYVEVHNDHIKIARQILDWLSPGDSREYDFFPTFYQNFTVSPELLKQERQKKWRWCREKIIKHLLAPALVKI